MTRRNDWTFILAIVGCIVAMFVLGVRDAWTGQLSGNSDLAELVLRTVVLFILFSVSLLIVADCPLISIGILCLSNMGLLRGILPLWADELNRTTTAAASGAYILVGLFGLVILTIGLQRGEKFRSPQPKSSSGVPAWLENLAPESQATRTSSPQKSSSDVPAWLKNPTPKSQAVRTPGKVASAPATTVWFVRILSLAGIPLNALAFQRSPLSESSGMIPIINMMCIAFVVLSITFILLLRK